MLGLILIVAVIIGFGLLQLLAPDLMWSWTQRSNELAGRASERTETWEMGRSCSGLIMIGAGIVLGVWGCSVNSERAAQDAAQTAVFHTSQTVQATDNAMLDSAFGVGLTGLLEDAIEQPQRVAAFELGVELGGSAQVDYGRCEGSGAFYMYVMDFGADRRDFLYTSGGICRHPTISYSRAIEIGKSDHGGTWFSLSFLRDSSALATTTYRNFVPTALPTSTPPANGEGSNE